MACTSVFSIAVAAGLIRSQPPIPIDDRPQTQPVRRPRSHQQLAGGRGQRIDVDRVG